MAFSFFPYRLPFPDILASPLIKPFVDILHPSAVMATAKNVFDELHAEMKSVATEFRLPEVTELTARIAERLQAETQRLPRPIINATGIFFHRESPSFPLPSAALEQMLLLAGITPDDAPLRASLCELTGGEDAIIFSNFVTAKMLATARGGEATISITPLMIARRDVYEQIQGDRLIDLHPPHTLIEVGAVNKTTPQDYLAAMETCPRDTIIYFASGDFSAGSFALASDEIRQVIAHAKKKSLRTIFELELATLYPLVAQGLSAIPLVREVVSWGGDLVIFRGGQLIGGPDVGIIVGEKTAIEKVRTHPLARPLRCDPLLQTALQTTLTLYRERTPRVEDAIPTLSLLCTSMENLKNRAERMAIQLTGNANISAAQVVAGSASLTSTRLLTLPTYQIEITLSTSNAETWIASLRSSQHTNRAHFPAILLRPITRENQVLACIDLRTIPAHLDSVLIAALTLE